MSIHFLADAPAWMRPELLLVMIPAALLVVWKSAVFRPRSVVGPERFDARDGSPGVLWMIALFAFGTWLLVPLFFINFTYGAELQRHATTQAADDGAATQPAASFALPPRETVLLGAASQLTALIVMLAADARFLREGGLARLGLAPSKIVRGLAMGAAGILVAAPLTWVLTVVVQVLWTRVGLQPPRDHELIRMLRDAPPVDLRLIVIISATFCRPVFEEILFRGHVQTALVSWFTGVARANALSPASFETEPTWPRWAGIALAALAFAVIHESGWMIPPLFALAVCFGYAYERTANLWVPIVMHALFNATNIAMVLYFR